jgi:ubiquinone/menaquinone biosynthesis C-methylase UbiE
MRKVERGQLGRWRQELLSSARGDVLEVGAGTGANLSRYPAGLTSLVLTEPDDAMRARMLRRSDGRARITADSALALERADGSIDTVVSTLVLCTVPDLDRALREIRRVLRPDGQLLVLEHVAAEPGTRRRRAQHRLTPLWARCAGGCQLERDTAAAMVAVGFDTSSITEDELPVPVPVIRRVIRGAARIA